MRTETEMIAYALEIDPALLPWIPDLLSDFDALGGNAALIVEGLAALDLPAASRVVDLGCGKGAVAVAIAKALGHRVDGIDLFAPFVDSARDRAAAAGVADRCRFRHGDILALAGETEPADAAVYAALGDVLGSLEDTVGVIRRYVRPGGFLLIDEGYLKDGATAAVPGYEGGSREDTRRRLLAHGDTLVGETVETRDQSPVYAQELAQIEARATALAAHRPELAADLTAYVAHQREAYRYLAANVVPSVWTLQRRA